MEKHDSSNLPVSEMPVVESSQDDTSTGKESTNVKKGAAAKSSRTKKVPSGKSDLHKCSQCDKAFASKRELHHHRYIHKEKPDLSCPVCAKNFTSEYQLKKHSGVHRRQEEKRNKCPVCGDVFQNMLDLEEHHRDAHLQDKTFTCPVCGSNFSWEKNLKRHMNMHQQQTYQCGQCSKGFWDMTSLRVHTRLVHTSKETNPDRPYHCGICKKDFKFDFSYEAHMNSHEVIERSQKKTSAGVKPSTVVVPAPVAVKNAPLKLTTTSTGLPPGKIVSIRGLPQNEPRAISGVGLKICPPRIQQTPASANSSTVVHENEKIHEAKLLSKQDMKPPSKTTTAELVTADGESREVVVEIVNCPTGSLTDHTVPVRDIDVEYDEELVKSKDEEDEKVIKNDVSGQLAPDQLSGSLSGSTHLSMPSLDKFQSNDNEHAESEFKEDDKEVLPESHAVNPDDLPTLSPPPTNIGEEDEKKEEEEVEMARPVAVIPEISAAHNKQPAEDVNMDSIPDNEDESSSASDVEEESLDADDMLPAQYSETVKRTEDSEEESVEPDITGHDSEHEEPSIPQTQLPQSGPTGTTNYNPLPVLQPVRSVTQAYYKQSYGISVNRPPPRKKPKKRREQPYIYNCVMHEETPFQCDICQQQFRWEVSLRIHKRDVHEGGPPKRRICRRKPPEEKAPAKKGVEVSRIVSKRASSDEDEEYGGSKESNKLPKRKKPSQRQRAKYPEGSPDHVESNVKPKKKRSKTSDTSNSSRKHTNKQQNLPPQNDDRLKVCHIREAGKGYTLYIARKRPDDEEEAVAQPKQRGRPPKSKKYTDKNKQREQLEKKRKHHMLEVTGPKRVTRSRSSGVELNKGIPMDRDEIKAANQEKKRRKQMLGENANGEGAINEDVAENVHSEEDSAALNTNGHGNSSSSHSQNQYVQDYEVSGGEEDQGPIDGEDEYVRQDTSENRNPAQEENIQTCLPQTMQAHLRWSQVLNLHKSALLCRFCGKVFTKRESRRIHLLRHMGHRSYSCNLCREKFPNRLSLLTHHISHREEGDILCGLCGRVCSDYGSLQRHVVFHVSCDSYSCSTCGRHFMKSSALEKHAEIHAPPLQECDTCHKLFRDPVKFDLHQKTGCIFSAFLG